MRIIILSMLLVVSSFVYSQEEKSAAESQKNRIGLHAGVTTGLGLSYRYKPGKFALQLTGIPIFTGGGSTVLSGGLSAMYYLREASGADLFTYFGNHVFYNDEMFYNMGLGIGIDFHPWKEVLDITLQGGYGVLRVNDDPISIPTIEVGLYYRF
ncbi:MAG: hypothetical protein COA32_08665 [Fluviicola sp.]|nr:MAG: hypothetical protein COA32_08665 [Fluviicola sp.]